MQGGRGNVAYKDWERRVCGRASVKTLSVHPGVRPSPWKRIITPRAHRASGRSSGAWTMGKPVVGLRVLQQHLNALRIMTRLVGWGMPPRWARAVVRSWERVAHRGP